MSEFAETAVLVALMNKELDEVDRLLDDFYPNELRTFEDQAHLLGSKIRRARARKATEKD